MTRKLIIDVSSYQADFSVADYKRSGAEYALVKVTESTNYTNPYANRQVNRMSEAGIKGFAFYHFARFGSSVSQAHAEARYFIEQTKAKFKLHPGTLMVLDAEITDQNTTSVCAFLEDIRNAGFKTGFYTYKYMLGNFDLNTVHKYADWFWLAAYPLGENAADANPNFNYFPSAPNVDVWQFTPKLYGMNLDASLSVTENGYKLFNPTATTGTPTPQKPVETKPKTGYETFTDELGVTWYKEKGSFTITVPEGIVLRWGATTHSAKIAVLPQGSRVDYDAFCYSGGYIWLRQPRGETFGYLPSGEYSNGKRTSSWGTFK